MRILEFIVDILQQIFQMIVSLLEFAYDKFLDMNLFEKGIILCFIPSLFAIGFPIAEYTIFGGTQDLSNPLAVYFIAILGIMFITQYFEHIASLIARILLNVYYLIWVIIIHFTGTIAQVDYSLTFVYYLNIIIPVILIGLSGLSYFMGRDY